MDGYGVISGTWGQVWADGTALADPDAFGAERIAVYGVSYDEVAVMDWAAAKEGELTIPFTATSVEYLDKIEP